MTTIIDEIKTIVKTDKAVIGTSETLKVLKQGRLEKIFITSNAPAEVKEDINHYAEIANVEVIDLPIPNSELGVICRKQFQISVMSVLK